MSTSLTLYLNIGQHGGHTEEQKRFLYTLKHTAHTDTHTHTNGGVIKSLVRWNAWDTEQCLESIAYPPLPLSLKFK